MGSDDAYNRVLDGEHRDIVKQAFNAMIQATGPLNQKPRDINLDGLEMGWRDLRQRIADAHKPIQHLFFSGIGNRLQFEDSCIDEIDFYEVKHTRLLRLLISISVAIFICLTFIIAFFVLVLFG